MSGPHGIPISELGIFQSETEADAKQELLSALEVIRTIATQPHHERAFQAIVDIATNTLAKVKGEQP